MAMDFIRIRGARTHNLKNIDLDIPRHAVVVFTGISGSGKSSLAFGTLFAEAQRRYLDSISPYARRLIDQVGVPEVDSIEGLPPAVALQQQRGSPTTRSSVGSVTTISNSLRMLYSRAAASNSWWRLPDQAQTTMAIKATKASTVNIERRSLMSMTHLVCFRARPRPCR